jgi:imidazolonepropionase-like amidohydrolase
VLTGVRLIDGTGRPPVERASVVIADGRIVAAGPAEVVDVPDGASEIDLTGRTVVPGLINAHAHLNNGDPSLSSRDQMLSQLRLYADYGVTTVYSLGDDGQTGVAVRNEQAGGVPEGARLFVSGVGVTPQTVEEAQRTIDGHADLGVDIIKTRLEGNANDMAPEVYQALIARAHDRGLRVAAHVYYLDDARALVEAGVDVLAHSVRDQDVDAAFIEELNNRGVGYIPTLTRDLSVFVYETRPAFFDDPFFLRGLDSFEPNRAQLERLVDPTLQEQTRSSPQAQAIKPAIEQAKRNLDLLSDGGVAIAMGTDSGTSLGRWQGYFEHTELELMVESGLSPMQALVAATGGAARVMRLDEVGALEPGKRADLLVLGADPLADIRNTRQIESVWIDGRRVAVR